MFLSRDCVEMCRTSKLALINLNLCHFCRRSGMMSNSRVCPPCRNNCSNFRSTTSFNKSVYAAMAAALASAQGKAFHRQFSTELLRHCSELLACWLAERILSRKSSLRRIGAISNFCSIEFRTWTGDHIRTQAELQTDQTCTVGKLKAPTSRYHVHLDALIERTLRIQASLQLRVKSFALCHPTP